MNNINVLNKEGILSDKDRKEPLSHRCNHFMFMSCVDLSEPVKVLPFGSYKEMPVNLYSQDLCSFISWWTHFVAKDLNGFQGFHSVKFELVGFELI